MSTNATKWVIDPTHSELLFKVKHLMITNVKGEFRSFSGELKNEGDDFSKSLVEVSVDADSIFTNNEERDTHLKSEDFFEVEKYKKLTFKATSFEKVSGSDYKLKGDLTIKDVTKPVTLDVEFGGTNTDPWGNKKAGFSLNGKINRKDWGLNWNAALETGGVLVGEEVKISAEVQFTKEA